MIAALLATVLDLPAGSIMGWLLAAALTLLLLRRMLAASRLELLLARDQAALAAAYSDLVAGRATGLRLRDQLEAVLAGTFDGVQILDAGSRLVLWNDRFPECTGVPRALLRAGMSLEDMLRGQAQAGEFGAVDVETEVVRRLALMQGSRELGVIERARPNGQVVELRRNTMADGGIVTLYTDVTARRRGEAARQETERLRAAAPVEYARFIDMIGAVMRTEIDALQAALPNPAPGQPDIARAHAARLERLVDDAQEMSLLDAGKVTLAATAFELRPLLERTITEQRPAADARGMRLELQVGADVPGWVTGDGARVGTIVRSMLRDAVSFADPGPVMLHVCRLGLGSQPILQVTVRDPGPPAPAATAARLFLPFARGIDTAGGTGSGLELAIAARLAELMQGHIGQGAIPSGQNEPAPRRELWVSLPLPAAEPGAAATTGAARPPLAPTSIRPSRRALVLLVEDIVVNQVVTATQLRRDGHRVDVAEDGATAVRLAACTPYDVVFMDLMMPGMSGFEAARHIRALPGPAGRTPIVALTANTSPDDRARCHAAGMMEMLNKPVRAADLSAALARALHQNHAAAPPPRPSRDDDNLLSLDRLTELRESLPDNMFASLAEQCLTEMQHMLLVLHAALAADQIAPIDAAAHALAGMAGGYGLTTVERRMRRIMAATHANNLHAARAAAKDMDAEANRSATALRTLLATPETGVARDAG